jgi:hypothetical protein
MSPSDLNDILKNWRSGPMRMTLTSGDQIIIERPDLVTISQYSLVFGAGYSRGSDVSERVRLISIPNIALIEEVPHRNGGRRRR